MPGGVIFLASDDKTLDVIQKDSGFVLAVVDFELRKGLGRHGDIGLTASECREQIRQIGQACPPCLIKAEEYVLGCCVSIDIMGIDDIGSERFPDQTHER